MVEAIIGSDLKVDFIGLHSLLKALGLSSKNNFCFAVMRVGLIFIVAGDLQPYLVIF